MRPADWNRKLVHYREPNSLRSAWELTVTLVPFLFIWTLAWLALEVNTALAIGLAVLNSGFLVRLFMIQHDCGHGAFFRDRRLNNGIGRAISVVTLTPYDVWRETHAIHHATTGNLDRRGIGDLPTLTIAEYRSRGRLGRFGYRLVRNPLFLFGVVPFFTFFLQNRIPVGLMRSGWGYWASAMATNVAIIAALLTIAVVGRADAILFIFLPTMLLAASAGMWMFYIQHQFEETTWDDNSDWNISEAALHGSSYYVLPPVLNWFTGNIGVHHVHHLASRIPFYRLGDVLRDHPALAAIQRVTLRESFRCARLHLWNEEERRLVTFAEANARPVMTTD
ncbi:fatty acid desaturase [Rhodobacterales bacterium HKCCE3408]|nr:fatty acid desaturase [Rhodobacterales bacterium HKCCE3408]